MVVKQWQNVFRQAVEHPPLEIFRTQPGSGPEYSLSRSSCGKGPELDNLPEVPSYLHYPLILWCLLACLHCWSSYTAWRPYTATGGMAISPILDITLIHTAFLLF